MTATDHKRLVLLIDGDRAGTLTERDGKIELWYDEQWRAEPDRTPLSLSLPLAAMPGS